MKGDGLFSLFVCWLFYFGGKMRIEKKVVPAEEYLSDV